jgi:hypothetical protein
VNDYLYHRSGRAIGFRRGRYVHNSEDGPWWQIRADTHVHKLSGIYVGELYPA